MPQPPWPEERLAELRRLHALGLSDSEKAEAMGLKRKAVERQRRRLGLPTNAATARPRRARAALARQLGAAGLANLAEVRSRAYRDFAARNGWPAGLSPREVQILNYLAAEGGGRTRRQIAEGVGLPWKGSRASLKSKGPPGSYLAALAARGLVTVLPRAGTVTGRGKGRSVHLYCLGPAALAILEARARATHG